MSDYKIGLVVEGKTDRNRYDSKVLIYPCLYYNPCRLFLDDDNCNN